MTADSPLIKPVTGTRGSVLLWQGGVLHIARANRSNTIRVGLNVAYYPRWFNNWIEGGHQPIWPETYQRLSPEMQALCPPRRGRTRAELYETP
jgi:ectoine hydroxylase-related dioxygenase (phytanoyl-CoA dioxygenase family)